MAPLNLLTTTLTPTTKREHTTAFPWQQWSCKWAAMSHYMCTVYLVKHVIPCTKITQAAWVASDKSLHSSDDSVLWYQVVWYKDISVSEKYGDEDRDYGFHNNICTYLSNYMASHSLNMHLSKQLQISNSLSTLHTILDIRWRSIRWMRHTAHTKVSNTNKFCLQNLKERHQSNNYA